LKVKTEKGSDPPKLEKFDEDLLDSQKVWILIIIIIIIIKALL